MTIKAQVINPAITIAFKAPSPIVGEMVLKLVVSNANGNAPALILSASSFADSYVKFPLMVAFPSEITALTDGAEIMVLSIQMEICPLS